MNPAALRHVPPSARRVLDACRSQALDMLAYDKKHDGTVQMDPIDVGYTGDMTYNPADLKPVRQFVLLGRVVGQEAGKNFFPTSMSVTKWSQEHYVVTSNDRKITATRHYFGQAETVEVDTRTGALTFGIAPSELCHWQ